MRIGILTAGGDCPGINAAIKAAALTAMREYGATVIGLHDGFKGLLSLDYEEMSEASVLDFHSIGGTYLGTSREKPYKRLAEDTVSNKSELLTENISKLGLNALICIGGNGTMRTVGRMHADGIPVIGIPKTIDNDVWGTDRTIGFDTATQIVADAIDRLRTTASSHHRVMVVEVMGHRAGWLALYGGVAGGADAILLPELGECNVSGLMEHIQRRAASGLASSIVVVAEGKLLGGKSHKHLASHIAQTIEEMSGTDARSTVLGYVQRGGTPSSADRVLATQMGIQAASLAAHGEVGRMVSLMGAKISAIPLAAVAGNYKPLPTDHELISRARMMGIYLG